VGDSQLAWLSRHGPPNLAPGTAAWPVLGMNGAVELLAMSADRDYDMGFLGIRFSVWATVRHPVRMPDLRGGLPVAVIVAAVVLAIAPAAVAAPMTSVTQPPVIEAVGVTAGVWKEDPKDFTVKLAFSLICPAGQPLPTSVVFSDPVEEVTERLREPCQGEWASNPSEGNAEGDFLVQALLGSPISGTLPVVTFSQEWESGIHPFLYQVIGPSGVIAQAPLSVHIAPMRLIYQGNPEYPADCVEPRRAARSTEREASCLVAATVKYYAGWPSEAHTLAPETYKPTQKWCPTNRTCFSSVVWTTYTATRAVGYGAAKTCPGGGVGPCHSYSHLAVELTSARRRCGATRFTRLRMSGATFRLSPGFNHRFCDVYQP
jgi:hypothetical protein